MDRYRGNLRESLDSYINLGPEPARIHALAVLGELTAGVLRACRFLGHVENVAGRNRRRRGPCSSVSLADRFCEPLRYCSLVRPRDVIREEFPEVRNGLVKQPDILVGHFKMLWSGIRR